MNIEAKIDPVSDAYSSHRFIYFDIETIPCQDDEYLLELERKVKPPANLKKPESIEKWLSENRKSEAIKAMSKTSFDGGRGHICTISWAKNDSGISVLHAKTILEERDVIQGFFDEFDLYHSETLVGHNISGFDIGFLRKRAIVLGVRLPDQSSFPRDPKPWDKSILDTMSAWAGGAGKVSMDSLCEILGVEGKQGFDGSMVASAWNSGDHDTIADYCKDDVWRTREIHKCFIRAGL